MGTGMSKILEGLYVGNVRDSNSREQLQKNGITHVISIHDLVNQKKFSHIKYLNLVARDNEAQDLMHFFNETNEFIHEARASNGKVLVHCIMGVSRSVSLCVAYCMSVTNLGWRDCLNAIRQARKIAQPNYGFQKQLAIFQAERLQEARSKLKENYPNFSPNDEDTLQKLLEAHHKWVLTGEEDKNYPLEHDAYKEQLKSDGKNEIDKR
ncbi:DgyrCDS10224 [Dimorphilus gyrociliatus]|uniref:Dual specificity protein phosphatase 15 n=1 Tax=Dimorphilus gyrociliatus TaxID=2664684 RepID=A0A7I8W0R3_9ANNE|nr:DgyrCDS10224 [Dimorphilus gyrociliatus]